MFFRRQNNKRKWRPEEFSHREKLIAREKNNFSRQIRCRNTKLRLKQMDCAIVSTYISDQAQPLKGMPPLRMAQLITCSLNIVKKSIL